MPAALETAGLSQGIRRRDRHERSCHCARGGRAPRADRSERRRQNDVRQSAYRCSGADGGADLPLWRGDHRHGADGGAYAVDLARTFQITQLFADMTPRETIGLAVAERRGVGGDPWRPLMRYDISAEVAGIGSRFGLDRRDGRVGVKLPYGKRRLLEIAIAFACRPRVLLLDEPAAAACPRPSARAIARHTRAALPRDVAVLLIEHDMDRGVQLRRSHFGARERRDLCAEGSADEIANDPRVRAVYLGASADA